MSKRSHQDDPDDLSPQPQPARLPSPNVGNGHGHANASTTNAPGAGHLATLQAALGDRPAPRKRSNPGPRPDLATLLPTLPASPALPIGGALGSPSITSPGILSPSHPHQQQQHAWGPVTANLVDSLTNSTANLSVRSRGSSMTNGVPPFLGHHVPSPADLSRALSQLPQYHQEQQPLQQPMTLQMQFQPAPPLHQQQQHPHPHSHLQQQMSPQPFDFVQQQFFGANGNGNGNQLTVDTHAASQYTGPSSFTAPHLRGLSANSATLAASPTTAGTPESLTAAATPTSATTPTLPHLAGGDTHPSGPSSAGSNNGSSSSASIPKRRPRATPDQLKILEETFLQTTSPNAQLRADLATRLSMTERSVQIWFQNKRAKVKNAQRKSQQEIQETAARAQMAAAYGVAAMGGPGAAAAAMGWPAPNGTASPMGSPFVHAPGIASPAGAMDAASASTGGAGLAGPMELLGSYLFSVDSLTVGTWRRAAQYSARSLFCAYAPSHQLFTWTITDNNYTFKMEMPFQHVSQLVMQCVPPPPPPTPPSAPVSPTTEGMAAQVAAAAAAQSQPQAELVITLTQAPMFWMQVDTATGKLWTQCNDFTENRQADTHLVHKLRGPPDALRAQVASLIGTDAALRERTTVEDPNRPGNMYSGDQALQVLPALMQQGIAPAAAPGQQALQQQQHQQQGQQAIVARPPGVAQHAQHPAVRSLVNRPRRSASAPMPPSFRSSPSAPSPLGGPALMPGLEHLSQQQQHQQMHLHQPFQHHQQAGMLQQDQRTFTAPHLRNQSQPNQYMATADPSVFQVPANAPPMPNASLALASPYNMMDLSQLSTTSASAPSSQQDFSSSSATVSASASPLVATNRPGRSNSDPAHVNLAAINQPLPPMPMAPVGNGDLFGDVFGLSNPMDHAQLAMYSFGNAAAAEGCDPGHGQQQQQQQQQQAQQVMMPQQQQAQEHQHHHHHHHQQQQQQQHLSQGQQQLQQQQSSSSAEFDKLMSSLVNV